MGKIDSASPCMTGSWMPSDVVRSLRLDVTPVAGELVQRGHREIKPQEVVWWAQIAIRVRAQVEDEGVARRY
jgi:hypothetical protein